MNAGYYRAWRAAHPEYRKRQNEVKRARRSRMTVAERRKDRGSRPSRAVPPTPMLYAALQRGTKVSWWRDELAMDLEQERALAICEGRDPEEAARAYRARETAWQRMTVPILEWAA